MRHRVVACSLLVALSSVACLDVSRGEEHVGFTTRDSVLHLGADDVRILSTDGDLELAVVGQQVLMRMSDQAVSRLRQELDTTRAEPNEGVGNWIEAQVKGTVAKVLDRQMVVPVGLITDARYEGGELRIRMRGSSDPLSFGAFKGEAKTTTRFAPGDAERFVEAVKAARGRRT